MFRFTTARLSLACCIALVALPPAAANAATQAEIDQSVSAGATWLEGKQTPATGAFPIEFGFDIVPTALSAANRHPADVANGGPSSQSAVASALSDPGSLPVGDLQQGILAAHAAGIDPARVAAGASPVAALASFYDDGYYGARSSLSSATFGLLSLSETAAPPSLLARGIAAVRSSQHNDGGWFFSTTDPKGNAGDTDSTSGALASLCGAGVPASDSAVQAGIEFLADGLQPSGGFNPRDRFGTQPNADTNAVAISALNACGVDPQGSEFTPGGNPSPIDFLLDQQATAGADAGSFPSFGPIYTTTQSVRALGGGAYTADPPARANAGDPAELTPATVPDGTSAPIALTVDDGAGDVRFCRVDVPSGSSLSTVLATANGASAPAGCATGGEFTAGQLSKLNGRTGSWAISTDSGSEQAAASQSVRFGDLVALRRTSRAVPVSPAGTTGTQTPVVAVPAAVQARTTPTGVASSSLRVSAKKRVITVSLSCARDNRSCEGKVFILHGNRTLGRREFTIGGGKTTKLNVKLSKSSLKRFGKKARKVKVNTFSRDGAGIASASSRTVTLTPTK